MQEQHRTPGPLANRDFRLLLSGSALGQMLGPLQFLTQILWVQHHAPQDIWLILVALIGACRGLGALTFGLYGGALADRFDRRKLLLVTQGLLVICTVGIAALMASGAGSTSAFIVFFALALLTAGLQSIDMPTRLALVPDVLGSALAPRGISLNQVAGQLAMPIAMFGTGFLIYALDFGGAYLVSVLGHLAMIGFLMAMHYEAPRRPQEEPNRYGFAQGIRDVRFGLAYAREHTVVLWVIILMVAMMGLVFPATANLGPTWVTKIVGVPVRDVGFVMVTWGIGSLLGAILMTRFSSIERRGLLIAGGAVLFCISFVVFVSDNNVTNAVLGNFGLGAGMTITMVSSTILMQQLVPNEVRGRIMSIFQLNMGVAQLMTMPIALLGQWLTLQVLFPLLAGLALATVLAILMTKRQILRA